jgi:ABC-type transport system involved in multi-copper enzyme maturation permease subunit
MNPLIHREFFGILRTRQAFAALLTLTVAFSVLVLARWPSDAIVDLSGSQSMQVFRVLAYGLLAGVMLLVPAFPASSIVREKNQGTLALLINSPLKSWSIYLGKLGGVLLFTLFLILTSLPAAAACYAMGGIELVGGFGLLYAVLLVLAVQYTALGLFVSSHVQSIDAGVRVTYALVFAVGFLTLGPHYIYQGQTGTLATAAVWIRYLSPIPIVMGLVGHGDVASHGLLAQPSGIREFFALSALLTIGLATATILRLNYRIFDRSRSAGVITQDRSTVGQVFRRLVFLVDPQRRKGGIPWYLNPVMVKEFRTRRFGRFHWLLRLVALCAVTSMLLTFAATTSTQKWGVETIGGLMVLLQVVLVALITPSLAAGLISGERESGGWDLLRMTPMSGFKILRGKVMSVVWTLGLVLFATLPGYLVMIYIKPVMWLQVYLVSICLLLTAVLTLMLSAAVGSLFRRTATATATVYVALIILFLGPLLIWLGRDAPFGHDTVAAALLATPTGAALSVIETPGFAQYELLPAAWWISGIASVLLLGLLVAQIWRLMLPR